MHLHFTNHTLQTPNLPFNNSCNLTLLAEQAIGALGWDWKLTRRVACSDGPVCDVLQILQYEAGVMPGLERIRLNKYESQSGCRAGRFLAADKVATARNKFIVFSLQELDSEHYTVRASKNLIEPGRY